MALFDDLTTLDPVTSTKLVLQQEQEQRDAYELANLQQGMSFRAKLGAQMGSTLGKGLGRGLANRMGIQQKDPRLEEAEKQAGLVQRIQGLSESMDPNSAEFARSAAGEAKAAGRNDLALKFITEASTRDKAKATLKVKTAANEQKVKLEMLKSFPNDVQLEIYEKEPDLMKDAVKDPRKRAAIVKSLKERADLKKLKDAQTLEEVKRSTATKLSATDLDTTTSIVNTLTQGEYEGDAVLEQVSRLVGNRAQTKANTIRDAGGEVDMTALNAEAFEELKGEGVIKHTLGSEHVWGSLILGNELSVDREALSGTKKKRQFTL